MCKSSRLCAILRLANAPLSHIIVLAQLTEVTIEFLFCLSFGILVLLLQQTYEPVTFALDFIELIVGDVAPPFLHTAPYLLPVAFKNVFIHDVSFLYIMGSYGTP